MEDCKTDNICWASKNSQGRFAVGIWLVWGWCNVGLGLMLARLGAAAR